MKNDLIERYIYAATKRLPHKIKDDISEELRGLIDDMLTERCGNTAPQEKDIKIVLTELGTPNEIYNKYNPDADKCLIGSPYYSTYKYVLKLVLICTAFGITLATVISSLTDVYNAPLTNTVSNATQFLLSFFGELTAILPLVLLLAFAFVTILFAIFYHKRIKIDTTDNLDNLPSVPVKQKSLSKGDSIVGIVLSVVFLCVFLIAPQIFCVIITDPFKITPIFNTETIHSLWYFTVVFSVIGIIRETVKLIEGQYTKKVMFTTITANTVSGVLTVLWLTHDNIINPEFFTAISSLFEGEKFILDFFANFNLFFMGMILFALIIDIITTVVKTLKD